MTLSCLGIPRQRTYSIFLTFSISLRQRPGARKKAESAAALRRSSLLGCIAYSVAPLFPPNVAAMARAPPSRCWKAPLLGGALAQGGARSVAPSFPPYTAATLGAWRKAGSGALAGGGAGVAVASAPAPLACRSCSSVRSFFAGASSPASPVQNPVCAPNPTHKLDSLAVGRLLLQLRAFAWSPPHLRRGANNQPHPQPSTHTQAGKQLRSWRACSCASACSFSVSPRPPAARSHTQRRTLLAT